MAQQAAVIGAGPAGLMAAEILSAAGVAVTVFEQMPSPARKFLMAGRGGLNLTHSEALEQFLGHYGDEAAFLNDHIRAFPPAALVSWAEGLGEACFTGSSGRIFPKSLKASPLLRAWLQRLEGQGVRLLTRQRWTGFDMNGALTFEGALPRFAAGATVLALGGASWPRLGSDGAWAKTLAAEGVLMDGFAPSNSGVHIAWPEGFAARFAGQPLKRIAITLGAQTIRGEAVITRHGLEGGVIYALSRAIRTGLGSGPVTLSLDLKPDMDEAAFAARLASARKGESLSNRLRKAGLSPPAAFLARHGKKVALTVTGVDGLERAISSAGGIRLTEVDRSLMLRGRPGVFVAGEMLSWEAPTGGYLLQASFATGRAAGQAARNWLDASRAAR